MIWGILATMVFLEQLVSQELKAPTDQSALRCVCVCVCVFDGLQMFLVFEQRMCLCPCIVPCTVMLVPKWRETCRGVISTSDANQSAVLENM